jgi:hypothetical protein
MEVRDAAPQDSAEPRTEAARIVERSGALRSSHHRVLHGVLGVCGSRQRTLRASHERRALVGQELGEDAVVHGL